jgi:hypothetical protein
MVITREEEVGDIITRIAVPLRTDLLKVSADLIRSASLPLKRIN